MTAMTPSERLKLLAAGWVPSTPPVPEGVSEFSNRLVMAKVEDDKRAKENKKLYEDHRTQAIENPKHFKEWLGTDEVDGFASAEVDRMHVKYKEFKSLLQIAKREVHGLRSRVVGREQPQRTLNPSEMQTLRQLKSALAYMHDNVADDLNILWQRTAETAEICKDLRLEDIGDATSVEQGEDFFRYIPAQLQQPQAGEVDAAGKPKAVKPLTLNVPWFGKSHYVVSTNTTRFAGLQRMFYSLSSHMLTLRLSHVQPRLGEVVFLRGILDSLVSGDINMADCWVTKEKEPVTHSSLGDLRCSDLLAPAFQAFACKVLQPFAAYWDVHKFLRESENYWRPEVDRLADRNIRYGACARGLLMFSDITFGRPERAPEGRLNDASVRRLRMDHKSLRSPLEALIRDFDVIRDLRERVEEGIDKLEQQHWMTDVFSPHLTTLHYGDDGSRDAVNDSYKELHQRLDKLEENTFFTGVLMINLRKTLAARAERRTRPLCAVPGLAASQPKSGSLASREALLANDSASEGAERRNAQAFEEFFNGLG